MGEGQAFPSDLGPGFLDHLEKDTVRERKDQGKSEPPDLKDPFHKLPGPCIAADKFPDRISSRGLGPFQKEKPKGTPGMTSFPFQLSQAGQGIYWWKPFKHKGKPVFFHAREKSVSPGKTEVIRQAQEGVKSAPPGAE